MPAREPLYDLARALGARACEPGATKAKLSSGLAGALGESRLPEVLRELGRDELRAMTRSHGLSTAGTKPQELVECRVQSSARFAHSDFVAHGAWSRSMETSLASDLSVAKKEPQNEQLG